MKFTNGFLIIEVLIVMITLSLLSMYFINYEFIMKQYFRNTAKKNLAEIYLSNAAESYKSQQHYELIDKQFALDTRVLSDGAHMKICWKDFAGENKCIERVV